MMKRAIAVLVGCAITFAAWAALPATDTFTGAAAGLETRSSDSGHSWGTTATNFDLNGSGDVVVTGQHSVELIASPASADYYVEIVGRTAGTTNNDRIGMYCRYDGGDVAADDGYRFLITGDDGGWQLDRMVNGAATTIDSGTQGSYSASTDYTYRLSCSGTTIEVFINGVSQGANTDSNISSAGNPGLYMRASGGVPLVRSFTAQHFSSGSSIGALSYYRRRLLN